MGKSSFFLLNFNFKRGVDTPNHPPTGNSMLLFATEQYRQNSYSSHRIIDSFPRILKLKFLRLKPVSY